MGGLLAFLIGAAYVGAAVPPLNPKFKFTPVNPELEGRLGVTRVYKATAGELHLKTVPIADQATAARAVEVSFGLIKGLYEPKKNPYAGEVTSLVQCDRRFAPREFSVSCPGGLKAKGLTGGAGGRHSFGMCRREDIQQIGAFFTCFHPGKGELFEVRLFMPYSSSKGWVEQLKKIEKTAREILQ